MSEQRKNAKHGEAEAKDLPQGYFIPLQQPESEDDIKFIDIWLVLLKYKHMIAAIVIICFIISLITAFTMTPLYRAQVLLAPSVTENGGNSRIASLANQFGGLADFAGISVGGNDSIDTTIAILKSRKFLINFINDLNLKPILFKDQWDNQKKEWIDDEPSFLRKIINKFLPQESIMVSKDLSPGEPSAQEAYNKFLDEIFSISQDKKTELITLSIEWEDPEQSAYWANVLIDRINDNLRQRTISEAERSIVYLKEQISQTSISELQAVLYRIVEEHTKNITLAKVNDEYALKIIDPAVPPEKKSKPKRLSILVMGSLLGLILGVFIVLMVNAVRNAKVER